MADGAPTTGGGAGHVLLSPRFVFSLLAVVLLLTVLFTPDTGGSGDTRLTTHSAAPHGARGLYELLGRLGWRTERRTEAFRGTLDSAAVYVVLDPPNDLTAAETHAVLDAVRRGAGLLFVAARGSSLADSLAIRRGRSWGRSAPPPADTAGCGLAGSAVHGINWPDGRVMSWWLEATAPLPADTVTFITVFRAPDDSTRRGTRSSASRADSAKAAEADAEEDEEEEDDAVAVEADSADTLALGAAAAAGRRARRSAFHPVAIGRPYGRGRVVAVADPDWLRNDVIRVCKWNAAPSAVRMAQYLSPDRAVPFVFDEYHQGYGRTASVPRAMRRALSETPPGRTLLQVLVASLLLLAAAGARPIAPRGRERAERRSPLEHVGALARAYEQIGATRIATRRLVRGLRRRHRHLFVRGRASDADFLRAIAQRHPALAADVGRITVALDRPVTHQEFLEVGRAVAEIERAIVG